MKVVHIYLAGPYNEGWTYQENLLSKYHAKLGNAVTLVCGPTEISKDGIQKAEETDYVNADGVHVIRLQEKINIAEKLIWYKGLKKVLYQETPDVIFVHCCQFMEATVVANYVRQHLTTRLYVDNHADYSNSATNFLSKYILHKVFWKHSAHTLEPVTQKFYGVLPARVEFLKEVYNLPPEKCELLVMGGDDELVTKAAAPEVREGIRDKYRIAQGDFLIVTGGKIDAFKAQTLLLMQAVRDIENPHIRLIVFGSIDAELKGRADDLTDGTKVQYAGWIAAKDSYSYFAAADLVVFPGRHSVFWEQTAAQGIPMICKDWPGTHHIDLNGNVEFLTEDTVEEIRHKIEGIVDEPEKYKKMKAVAVEKGMKAFSYMEIAKHAIEM